MARIWFTAPALARAAGREPICRRLISSSGVADSQNSMKPGSRRRIHDTCAGMRLTFARAPDATLRECIPLLRRGGQDNRAGDLLEVKMGQVGVGIARGDDLALLGDAEAPVDAARGLGADGVVGGSAAARNGAAAPVEDGQLDAMFAPRL
jgi:hypothetical protein